MSAAGEEKHSDKLALASLPIVSFARIKPVHADKCGGAKSAKGISFDAAEGIVRISGGARDGKPASHFTATIPPGAAQAEVYDTVCAPLVAKWLAGYDADVISYGQTGSGKTFTMFGPPHAMAEVASVLGADGGRGTIAGDDVVQDEHGFILRTGFEALAAVEAINRAGGGRAVLHGSMVEMSIKSFQHQGVLDLLNHGRPCYVDKDHHLQGACTVPLRSTHDLVHMAAAVEARITR